MYINKGKIQFTFQTEIKDCEDWINSLNPNTDGEKIGKLQVVLDCLKCNYRDFMIANS